jgi:hypothetical protein
VSPSAAPIADEFSGPTITDRPKRECAQGDQLVYEFLVRRRAARQVEPAHLGEAIEDLRSAHCRGDVDALREQLIEVAVAAIRVAEDIDVKRRKRRPRLRLAEQAVV